MSPSLSKPISAASVPWVEYSKVPRFGMRYRHLSLAAIGEGYRVGVGIEELAPGMRSNPMHYHIFEEELVYVLEGSMTVRIGAGSYEMKAGDYACFPAGQKAGHGFVNESGAVCRYVILGENRPDEVAVYTDSKKVLVRSLGRRARFAATRRCNSSSSVTRTRSARSRQSTTRSLRIPPQHSAPRPESPTSTMQSPSSGPVSGRSSRRLRKAPSTSSYTSFLSKLTLATACYSRIRKPIY
jgi:uncharacterized cupin superfamily protein